MGRLAPSASPASLLARKPFPAGGAQPAGGALAAAISPVETLAALAQITRVRLFHDQARQAFAAKLLGEAPGAALSSHISGVRIVNALSMPSESAVWVARIVASRQSG